MEAGHRLRDDRDLRSLKAKARPEVVVPHIVVQHLMDDVIAVVLVGPRIRPSYLDPRRLETKMDCNLQIICIDDL